MKAKILTSIELPKVILPIGSIATALNVSQRTLRIYDAEGILVPKRTDKNRRDYTLDDLEKAKLILFLTRNLMLNLAGVKIVLSILEKEKIKPSEYMSYIREIAKNAKIDLNKQESNIVKSSNRGRRPSNKNKTNLK